MNRKPRLLNSYLSEELRANIGKNIFSEDFENSVMTLRITGKLLEELRNISLNYKHRVLEDLVNKVIRELCRVNQYYYFGEKEKKELKLLYASLLDRLLEKSEDLEARLPEIRSTHVGNLRGWLLKTNPFVEKHRDKDKYLVETIAIPNLEIRASKVKRLLCGLLQKIHKKWK